jgi:uncharacterized protein (TIGR03083 family)
VNHEEHCDALEVEIERFASTLEDASPSARVPSCPEWSVHDLASHLGVIHRWAQRLVATRSPEWVGGSSMDLERGPVDATWLRRGGDTLVTTLRSADPVAEMWAWGPDHHVRWWSRRQLHETLVHRIDLELGVGTTSLVEPFLAVDAIDEFLVNLESAGRFSPRVRELRGDGGLLQFSATDASASWTVELRPEGFALVDAAPPDAQLRGRATELLCVLYRRLALEDSDLLVTGDRPLMDFWLSKCALE